MCIGGELEHHKTLPSHSRKKQSSGVLCSRGTGIYSHVAFSPGSCQEPGPMPHEAHWSLFVSRTGTKGSRRTGTNAPRGPAGPLGARTGTYAPMGPGS